MKTTRNGKNDIKAEPQDTETAKTATLEIKSTFSLKNKLINNSLGKKKEDERMNHVTSRLV